MRHAVFNVTSMLTTTGFACAQVDKERGPVRAGLAADFIAVRGNPLEDIDTLHRLYVGLLKNLLA